MLFNTCMFDQALLMDVCLSMCRGRLLRFTHSTITQLLCREDDRATFLPWDSSVEKSVKKQNNKSFTVMEGHTNSIKYFSSLGKFPEQQKVNEA